MNFGFTPIEELKAQGKKLLAYYKAKKYPVEDFNICYIEGINTDLVTLNSDAFGFWNDVRIVFTSSGDILMACLATTEPGKYYTYNRMNPKGAARIAFGYYKNAWQKGWHRGKQWALVQCGTVSVYRDDNEDGIRTGDFLDRGNYFAINQHFGYSTGAEIGRDSAGCLVGKFESTHIQFMDMCEASGKTLFSTAVIDGTDFAKFKG